MNTAEQTLILTQRSKILKQLAITQGTVADRMKGSVADVAALGRQLSTWVDITAIQYRNAGMEIDEWYDDIVQWFVANDFLIEEVESVPHKSGRSALSMHCHLSTSGIGRFIVIKFTMAK